MAKGGARASSGPPPDPHALRRDRPSDAAGWTTLPATGREGDPPLWPLDGPSDREAHWWAWFWAKPQATQWERAGLVDEVAVYVRRFTEAEAVGASVALGTLVKQLAEQLGLTIPGVNRMRWRIGQASTTAQQSAAPSRPRAAVGGADSFRDRLKVIDGGAA